MRYERVVFVLPSSYFSWECVWLFADKRKLTDWSVIKWWRKRCSECNHNKVLAVQSFLPFWGDFNLSSCVGRSMIVQCHYWFHSQLKVGNSQLVGCNYNFRDCVCVSLSDIILSLGFGVNSFQSCVRVWSNFSLHKNATRATTRKTMSAVFLHIQHMGNLMLCKSQMFYGY